MLLDLEDANIRARLVLVSKDRLRLTVEYPRSHRDRVMAALSDLLRPRALPTRLRPKPHPGAQHDDRDPSG